MKIHDIWYIAVAILICLCWQLIVIVKDQIVTISSLTERVHSQDEDIDHMKFHIRLLQNIIELEQQKD